MTRGKLFSNLESYYREYAREFARQSGLEQHDDARQVRFLAANPHTPGDLLSAMALCEEDAETLSIVAAGRNTPQFALARLAGHPNADVRAAVSENPRTDISTLRLLAVDPNDDVRYGLAENHNIPKEILELLTTDANPIVAWRAGRTLERLATAGGAPQPNADRTGPAGRVIPGWRHMHRIARRYAVLAAGLALGFAAALFIQPTISTNLPVVLQTAGSEQARLSAVQEGIDRTLDVLHNARMSGGVSAAESVALRMELDRIAQSCRDTADISEFTVVDLVGANGETARVQNRLARIVAGNAPQLASR